MTDAGVTGSLVGQSFHEYRIERLLAQGGMGAVYLLRHAQFPNIRKVLKVILPEYARRADIRERFQCEADAVSQLGTHPNIVGIDNVSVMSDGQLCMLVPFVDGKPLDEFVRDHGGKLVPHRTMHVLTHIARALHHAHGCGIVHRDLKPSNVFVEPTDNDPNFCKVLDFGIAKRMYPSQGLPSRTQAGPMGTPSYMAVEQYEHAAEATASADVYALACLAWELVTGALPWGTLDDTAVIYRRKLQDPPDRPVGNALFPEWEGILRSALAVEPLERPTLRQLMLALASALPAIRPHVPSGVEILRNGARKLFEGSGPDDETVRSPSSRTPAPLWPPRVTRQPGTSASLEELVPLAAHGPPPNTPTPGRGSPIGESSATPPNAIPALALTTLGGSTGVVVPRASSQAVVVPGTGDTTRRRLFMGTLASFIVVVAAIVAITMWQRRTVSQGSGVRANDQPARSVAASTAPPGDAAIQPPPTDASAWMDTTTPDAARPVDARRLNAAIEDASIPIAARHHRTPAQEETRQALPTSRSPASPPGAERSDRHRGSDDTFNRNAAGGDE